jgi:hypothetical protein
MRKARVTTDAPPSQAKLGLSTATVEVVAPVAARTERVGSSGQQLVRIQCQRRARAVRIGRAEQRQPLRQGLPAQTRRAAAQPVCRGAGGRAQRITTRCNTAGNIFAPRRRAVRSLTVRSAPMDATRAVGVPSFDRARSHFGAFEVKRTRAHGGPQHCHLYEGFTIQPATDVPLSARECLSVPRLGTFCSRW